MIDEQRWPGPDFLAIEVHPEVWMYCYPHPEYQPHIPIRGFIGVLVLYRDKKYRVYDVEEYYTLGRWDSEYWQFRCNEEDRPTIGSALAFSIVGRTELLTLAEEIGVYLESEITVRNGLGSGKGLSGSLQGSSRGQDPLALRGSSDDRDIGARRPGSIRWGRIH